MSTVYGARGMHIMAESRPPYSLGLFGHRSNPFLEAFEKATQLCRLINCKSWPSPNYCMKLHRKVSWSPGKPVALKTETNFKTPEQVCYPRAGLLPTYIDLLYFKGLRCSSVLHPSCTFVLGIPRMFISSLCHLETKRQWNSLQLLFSHW